MEEKIKTFRKSMNMSNSSRVLLLTNHYQMTGKIQECDENNKSYYLSLTDVIMCNIDDAYEEICESGTRYERLHIDLDKIVAYSFL